MSTNFSCPELPAKGIVATLADEDRSLLSNYGEFLPVQPGTTIIEEGRPQDSLFFIISGVLHVHTDAQTRRTLIARVEEGETIGEVNVFDPGTASASVTAKEFSQIWKANHQDIEAFVTAYPEAGARLLASLVTLMSRRIRRMNERLAAKENESDFHDAWH